MADDLAAMVQTVEALRKKTNTALGHLPARMHVASLIGYALNAMRPTVWWNSLLYGVHRHG